MRYFKMIALFTVPIFCVLTFGLGPRGAHAGACGKLGLADECVKRRDIADNAINSAKVKNDSLKAKDLKDEAGADFASGEQRVDLPITNTVLRSVTITAPRAGVVIVNATGTLWDNSDVSRAYCSITTGTTVEFAHEIYAETPGNQTATIAGTRGFEVEPGSTTFNLVCRAIIGSTAEIIDTSITAFYVPTRY